MFRFICGEQNSPIPIKVSKFSKRFLISYEIIFGLKIVAAMPRYMCARRMCVFLSHSLRIPLMPDVMDSGTNKLWLLHRELQGNVKYLFLIFF